MSGGRSIAARGLAAALLLALAGGCTSQPDGKEAVLEVEGFGEIRFELLRDVAPKTVANFITLARDGFYDGTTFHRVIPGFMIQGGDPNTKDDDPRNDGLGGPGRAIEDEFNATQHVRGVVSMAHKGFPRSAGSQFFIVLAEVPHLDGKYTAFGRVTSGMEIADRIAAVERDRRDRPLQNVAMRVRIE
jgi:peptidyl-prolyl cis-trans isomerase B (cyclophilin B)